MPETEIQNHVVESPQENSSTDQPRPYFAVHPHAKYWTPILCVLMAIAGYFVWLHYSARESTDDAQIQGHLVSVSPRVGGTVIKVFVQDNQYVEAGTVLAQLDPRDYQVALERATGELLDAQAQAAAAQTSVPISHRTTQSQLATARAGVAAAQQEASAADARIAEAEANYSRLATDLKRMQQLISKDEISQQQYDAIAAQEKAARATLEAARAAHSAAASKITQAEAQLEAASTGPEQVAVTRSRAQGARGMVETRGAARDQAELNLGYATIKAPVSGVVRKSVEVGQVVQPGQAILSIVPPDDIWVIANFKENQLRNMKPAQPATIHVDAFDKDFRGHVDSIGGATAASYSLLPPENATGNYVKVVQRVPVKIVFEPGQDPEHRLRPGLSVVPTVLLK